MNSRKLTTMFTVVIMIISWFFINVNAYYSNTEWKKAVNFMKNEWLSSTANSVEEYIPLSTVKREAAAKFFVNFAEKEFNLKADTTKDCSFIDINQAQDWAKSYIIKACQMWIIKGSNGYFMPKATLTKLQFLTILARIVKNNSSLEPAVAFKIMKTEGITKASSLADTVRPVSRIELAILFQRSVEKYKWWDNNNDEEISEIIDWLFGNE